MPALDILTIPVGQLATQCYLVSLPERDDCIVIDPGAEPERIRAALQKKRLAAILLTHGHFDHIGAVSALMDADTPLYIHALDAPMLADPKLNLCRMIGQTITAPPANHLLQEGDLVQAAGIILTVLHTPGHTPGSVCYRAGDVLFTGDTLFRHECGRCDLEGGDFSAMLRSLKRLSELEGDYKVLPGHEGISTLDEERVANPYMLQARGR